MTEYMPLGPFERTALIDALKEMVEVYQDEKQYGKPLPLSQQPMVIQRAMRALKATQMVPS